MLSWNLLYFAALLSVSTASPQIIGLPASSPPIATASSPPTTTAIASSSVVTSTIFPSSSLSAITSIALSSTTTTPNTTIISVPVPSGTPVPSFKIHPNGNTAKCLDVRGAKLANGTPVQIFDCNGTPAQQWLIALGDGHVVLAGTNFCLDAGSIPANGVGMKIWECFNNLPAQDWFYTTDQRIALANQGYCLDLTGGNSSNSNQIQTWKCTDNDKNQVWSISN